LDLINKKCVCAAALAFHIHRLGAQPVIVQEPQSRAAAEGRHVAFVVEAQSASALHYQWQFNGADIPHAVGHSLSFTATPSRAGNYSVIVRDAQGAIQSSPAQLEVQKRPVILSQPRHQVVGVHQTAVWDVRLNDSGPYTYVNWWHHSPEEPRHEIPLDAVATANQFHMEIPDCNNNGTYNGLYWILVSNNVGYAVSRRASLTVVGPPRLTAEPQDRTVHHGGTATFSVVIAPDAASGKSCQWFRDSQPIPGATHRILRLHNVQAEDQGFYHCAVSSIGGTTTSYDALLTVY
jgi:hypothetical protein